VIRRQFSRWLIVGLVSNGLMYLAYLALTRTLLDPMTAMTVVYCGGVLLGFIGHRKWSFEHSGRVDVALLRYLGVYAIGYVINLGGLAIGLSALDMRHEFVQATMVLIVAVFMFLMQRYFVFPRPASAQWKSSREDG